MKIFFIFNIKNDIFDTYRNTPSVLYNYFYNIYSNNKINLDSNNTLFKEVADKFNKDFLDLKIYLNMHYKMRYSKKLDNHIINDIFNDEISILRIKKSYIVINSNRDFSEFFNIINYFSKTCLVCDFNNQRYFYLSDIKTLV